MKSPCIKTDILDRYIDGSLSEHEKEQTEKHFLICDKCLEKFVIVKEMVMDPELINYQPDFTKVNRTVLQAIYEKAGIIKEKIRKFFEWVPDLSIPEWAGVPVRSGSSDSKKSVFVKRKMDDLNAELFLQKTDNNESRIFIKVFKGNRVAKNVSLKFGKQGKRAGEILLCREEDFFEKKISFGAYYLSLEQDKKEKGNYLFTIDSKGIYEG